MSNFKNFQVLLFLALVGCSSNSNSPQGNDASPPGQVKGENNDGAKTNNYVIESKLNISFVGDDLESNKGNIVSLIGTGPKSEYKAIYIFNSGNFTRFKVIEKGLKIQYGNCSSPDSKMFFVDGELRKEISVLDNLKIEAHRDYKLEVQLDKNLCDKLDITFDVIVWLGDENINPKIASVCQHRGIGEATFFSHVNAIDAYSSQYGQKFLSSQVYCGEDFKEASKSHCVSSMYGFINDRKSNWGPVTCDAESNTGEKRSFSYSYNAIEKTARVECVRANSEKFTETFADCRTKIVDYLSFSKVNR